MAKIKGDLQVTRTIDAGRRVNQTGATKALVGAEALTKHSPFWNNFTAEAPQDVILPDATTLVIGWKVVVNNKDASNGLAVKNNDAGATVKSVIAGRAYEFTCEDISSADGAWHINYLEESDLVPAERYTETFNATTDWTENGDYYTLTVDEATHQRGTSPTRIIEELDGSDYNEIIPDNLNVASNGDVTIRVMKTPEGRFAGRITLV
jgi:hypothetical protein